MGWKVYNTPTFDKSQQKWRILITDSEGNEIDVIHVDGDEDAALNYIKQKTLEELNKNSQYEAQKLNKEVTFLENFVSGGGDLESHEDTELELKRQLFHDDFIKKKRRAESQSRVLLMNVANLYLDADIINNSQYVKFKLQIESKGLGSLIFQLETAQEAIYTLLEEIHVGKKEARKFEVLTGLQRVVLDISKYQHELMYSIEESIKKIKDDINNAPKKTDGYTDVESAIDVEVIPINNRKKLIDEISAMVTDVKNNNKMPKSVNTNLSTELETVDNNMRLLDDGDDSGDDDMDKNFGLSSM